MGLEYIVFSFFQNDKSFGGMIGAKIIFCDIVLCSSQVVAVVGLCEIRFSDA